MDKCFSHFIVGKIIVDGVDKTGFSVIGKSNEIKDHFIGKVLPKLNFGQIYNWSDFYPIYCLTAEVEENCRAFYCNEKSS